MGFLRVLKAVATGGLSELGGTPGRVAEAVLTGGASEITNKASDLHNQVIDGIADGLGIDLDKAGWLDPRRPVSLHADLHRAPRQLAASAINDGINHHEELIRGGIDLFEGKPDRLINAALLRPIDMVVGNGLLASGMAISGVQTALGWEKPSRGLTSEEERQLRMVFGDSIDYSQVRIKEGNAGLFSLNDKDRPFTTGNTIYMKKNKDDAGFERTLFHEMMHVWQFQNGGASYQSGSLRAQAFGGDDPYNYRDAIAQGKKWNELNPEQQAHLIEDAWFSGIIGDPTRTTGIPTPDGEFDFINAEIAAYMRAGWEEMKARRGAH